MRGKVPTRSCQALARGITPAYAGKSIQRGRPDHASRDHPRVCGEKHGQKSRFCSGMGSPPRMRGKDEPFSAIISCTGITPAYAGKRAGSSGNSSTAGDHPRVCGEKGFLPPNDEVAPGSPPRMRGKVPDIAERVRQVRITPAYAGKSLTSCPRPGRLWDHPRVCGEKLFRLFVSETGIGSPPRMRGKD